MTSIKTQIENAYKKNELIAVCLNKIDWDKRIIGYVKKIYKSNEFDLEVIDEMGQKTGVKNISFPSVKSLEMEGSYMKNLKLLYKYGFVKNQSRTRYFSTERYDLYKKLGELKETVTLCTFVFDTEYSVGIVSEISEKEFSINNIGFDGREEGTSAYDITLLTQIRCQSNRENMIAFLYKHSQQKQLKF